MRTRVALEVADTDGPGVATPRRSLHDHAMKLEGIPFQSIDWSRIAPTSHPGAPGVATWRTLEVGNVRVRKVEYSPGYVADHWCERGHVLLSSTASS
jgi:hypothetical protein